MMNLSLLLFAFSLSGDWQEGVGTHFQAIGSPYGACGVPESVLAEEDALDYVALNVFDAPGNYQPPGDFGKRPLEGTNAQWLGAYDNGRNCGRWLEVELGDDCKVANGGEAGSPICGGGTGWQADALNGAKLFAIVTDQCTDNNAWCRDNASHLDLHTPALNHFKLPSGAYIPPYATESNGSWYTSSYNNRKVKWKFVKAPHLNGDLHIFFSIDSKPQWRRIMITNLPNGIHGVEQWDGAQWAKASMEGDMGQLFILPRPELPEPHKIRIIDAEDKLVYDGRTYSCTIPAQCTNGCPSAAVPAECIAEGGNFENPGTPILQGTRLPQKPFLFKHYNLLGQLLSR